MRTLLIGLLVFGSVSTFAQDMSRGGVLKFEIDWQRTFDVLTLKEYKSNQKAKIDHCKQMYLNLAETSALIDQLTESGEIEGDQLDFYLSTQDSIESIADSSCRAALGERKASKVKEAILKP